MTGDGVVPCRWQNQWLSGPMKLATDTEDVATVISCLFIRPNIAHLACIAVVWAGNRWADLNAAVEAPPGFRRSLGDDRDGSHGA